MFNRILRASVLGLGLFVAAVGLQAASGSTTRVAPAKQAVAPQQTASSGAPAGPPSRALVDKYCITCHSERLKTGKLVLEKRDLATVATDGEVWEKVLRKVRSASMPPGTAPKPDPADRQAFVSALEASLDRVAAAKPNPGRGGIHRLNRVEYTNAIRDLLALEINGRELLPADDSGYGFDNIGDALSVSPGLLERYMAAAQKIGRMAMGDPRMKPAATIYSLPFFMLQDDRASGDLPFGSRGGIAVRHYFPLDGEYALQIRLQRSVVNLGGGIRGLDEVNRIDVRVDGALVKSFTIGGGKGEQDGDLRGPYTETDYERFADDPLNVRFPAKAGTRVVGITFQQKKWLQEGIGMSRLPVASYGYSSARKSGLEYGKVEAAVDNVEIRGPFNGLTSDTTPSREKLFVCRPATARDEEPCARRVLSTLARRAYRRPVTVDDVQALMSIYEEGRRQGSFDSGIQWALERLLVDPRFLYRMEQDPANLAPGTPYRLADLELASRLSFFLWSTIPDDELIDVAARGKLKDPAVFEQQVRRMLKDQRSGALVSGFFGQWLWLRNVASAKPDTAGFPEFDEALRRGFQRETDLFLESQLREDHSVLDLLTANYTYVNERLAKHYGIPNVYGTHFRRVTLPDSRRAGLLGQGSILLVTSYANRTSPVQRGKWLLQNILGAPPPEPPANVPPFPENDGTEQPKSVRARLEMHRKNPVCSSCHSQMDPLGFALENFDAIGHWRTTDQATVIDPSGVLPSGVKFSGPVEFRASLLAQRDLFMGNVTQKLLTYALGRGVEYYDLPVVRQIARESAGADYRWSSLILAITKSMPFQMRRSL